MMTPLTRFLKIRFHAKARFTLWNKFLIFCSKILRCSHCNEIFEWNIFHISWNDTLSEIFPCISAICYDEIFPNIFEVWTHYFHIFKLNIENIFHSVQLALYFLYVLCPFLFERYEAYIFVKYKTFLPVYLVRNSK